MSGRLLCSLLVSLLVAAAPPTTAPSITQASTPPRPAAEQDGVAVYFSPGGGAAAAVIYWIDRAERTLDVATYSMTHAGIAKAVVEAHKRGVKVRVVMDPSQAGQKYSSATTLHNLEVPVFIERGSGIMHNKYAVIDGVTVLTGSFNWTKAGDEVNDENLLVIQGRASIAGAFASDFEDLLKRARPYERKQ